MDAPGHRRSPPAERFIGLFSSPPGYLTAASAATDDPGVELGEDDVFWAGADIPSRGPFPANARGESVAPLQSPLSPRSFRSLSAKSLGILAALPEKEDGSRGFLRQNSSLYPASHAFAPPSHSSSAWVIPAAIPKPKNADYSSVSHQSAPVDVPVIRRGGSTVAELDSDDYDDEEMLPPHEIVARKGAPATTSSVLEGVGRTLKGRDLRRVRNAVWRQTGFLD